MSNSYTADELALVVEKLSKLIFINKEAEEFLPSKIEIEKMLALCKKRNNPSYYKLRHASGRAEEYGFKGINMYSNDGKKMRRFKSGLNKD